VARQRRQALPIIPVNQEQHSLGQCSIPRRKPAATLVPPRSSRIAPLTVPLSDYEQLQKNFKELKHQNYELKMNNEERMRRLQEITSLLHELMPNIHIPYMGQAGAGGEHWRSQHNFLRAPR